MATAGDGIEVGPHSVLIRNLARENGGSGLNVGRGESLILYNTTQGNRSHGIDGGGTSWVSENLVENNAGEGVFLTVGSLATKNVDGSWMTHPDAQATDGWSR